ncbi:hypothetical protein NDU88_005084 [Pleurodeles waltl]|uniref:Uncharacterized protein n=1 Tax=Pleurodeles waltl TaxID=8319 RepID=A0AAV7RHI3_PLEWA|nr:hypothetical protein NDU88_005084 [Pleurodeles waltl]
MPLRESRFVYEGRNCQEDALADALVWWGRKCLAVAIVSNWARAGPQLQKAPWSLQHLQSSIRMGFRNPNATLIGTKAFMVPLETQKEHLDGPVFLVGDQQRNVMLVAADEVKHSL